MQHTGLWIAFASLSLLPGAAAACTPCRVTACNLDALIDASSTTCSTVNSFTILVGLAGKNWDCALSRCSLGLCSAVQYHLPVRASSRASFATSRLVRSCVKVGACLRTWTQHPRVAQG